MNYNTENTIVVVISTNTLGGRVYEVEQNVLNQYLSSHENNVTQTNDWIYISTGGNSLVLNELNATSSFILYNQVKGGDNFDEFISKINDTKKHVLIYWHETDNHTLRPDVLRMKFNNLIECIPFSHGENEALYFMNCIGNNNTNYTEKFGKLIQEYLKKKAKPHLIALSILCQGYLAAHWEEIYNSKKECLSGLKTWDSLLRELRDKVKANKDMTAGQGWWKPAFADVFEEVEKDGNKIKRIKVGITFEKTSLYNELDSLGKECKDADAIKNLFKAIRKSNGNDFTGTVVTANACIKEILKGK